MADRGQGPLSPISGEVKKCLEGARVPAHLLSSRNEREFQRWIHAVLEEHFRSRFTVLGEASGGGVPSVRTFGTGSWPDVAICVNDARLLAIEVKCLWQRGLPNRVAHALGQALLYVEADDGAGAYENALVVFLVVEPIKFEFPSFMTKRLAKHGIGVAVIRAEPIYASLGILKGSGFTFEEFMNIRNQDRERERLREERLLGNPTGGGS